MKKEVGLFSVPVWFSVNANQLQHIAPIKKVHPRLWQFTNFGIVLNLANGFRYPRLSAKSKKSVFPLSLC
jgi:hypothetical protein